MTSRYRTKSGATYVDPREHSLRGKVRTALMALIDQHRRDGALPTSVRFLFYELEMQKVINKSQAGIVSIALTNLRQDGLVPWEDIVDETRSVSDFTGSTTVAQDWLAYLNSARIDPWRGQAPFIITESRSLAGVLRDIAREYRVRICSTNGQVGGFLHTDIEPVLNEDTLVGYLGDYDLAGNQIEANTRRVLEQLVGELDWTRLALTEEQLDSYDLRRLAISKHDGRFKKNKAKGKHEAVETEALSQTLIVSIVREWLDGLLPKPLDSILVHERRERARLRRLIEG